MEDDNPSKGTKVIKDPSEVAKQHAKGLPVPPKHQHTKVLSKQHPRLVPPAHDADRTAQLAEVQYAQTEPMDRPTGAERYRDQIPNPNAQIADSTREAGAVEYEAIIRKAAQAPHIANRRANSTIEPPQNLQEISKMMPSLPLLPLLRTQQDGIRPADIKLKDMLGRGGAGVVYLAKQHPLARDVAVKSSHESGSPEELLHEAMVTGYLEHPNIIPVHHVGRDEGGEPLIVMKRVEGVTWDAVIYDPLNAPTAGEEIIDLDWHLDVLLQVCNALRFAHSRHVVHRDIKPANIMIGTFGEVYLLDWGIALSYKHGESPPFMMTTWDWQGLAGTPSYMAPEMTQESAREIDHRTDIFLMGAILHELLTGEPPNGIGPITKTLVRAFNCEPHEYPPSVPRELAAIAQKAMARDHRERYQTIEAFRDAIINYREHRQSVALAREVERRLDGLEARIHGEWRTREESELVQQLIESRFALKQSLKAWPENHKAQESMTRLNRISFLFFMHVEDLGSANAIVNEMSQHEATRYRPRLEEALAARGQERDEIRALRHDFDPNVDLKPRLALGIGMAVVWELLAVYKAAQRWGVRPEDVDPNYLVSIIPTVLIPTILAIVLYKSFQKTAFNRRVFLLLAGGLGIISMMRFGGWAMDSPAYLVTGMEFVVYTFVAFYFGSLLDNRLAMASALPLAVATVLAMFFPMYQYAFMAGAFLLFAPYVGWVWVRMDKLALKRGVTQS